MVYIHSWQEFQDAAEGLYAKSPNNVRAFKLYPAVSDPTRLR